MASVYAEGAAVGISLKLQFWRSSGLSVVRCRTGLGHGGASLLWRYVVGVEDGGQ